MVEGLGWVWRGGLFWGGDVFGDEAARGRRWRLRAEGGLEGGGWADMRNAFSVKYGRGNFSTFCVAEKLGI